MIRAEKLQKICQKSALFKGKVCMTTMTENIANLYICLIFRDVHHLTILKHISKYNFIIGKFKYYEMLVVLNPPPKPPLNLVVYFFRSCFALKLAKIGMM